MTVKIDHVVATQAKLSLKTSSGEEFFLTINTEDSKISVWSEENPNGINVEANPVYITPDELFKIVKGKRPENGLKDFGDREIFKKARKHHSEPKAPSKFAPVLKRNS